MDRPYPEYSRSERVADGIIHMIGLVFGLSALTALLIYTINDHSGFTTFIVAVYGGAMVLMLFCSAAYHMIPMTSWKVLLRRFDQAAIFLKIAGTYTPFAVLKMGGIWGYGLLGTVWIIALAGAGMILSLRKRHSNMIVLLYLALGWVGIMVIWPLIMSLSFGALMLVVSGGLLYSAGTIFHVWESLPFSNVIWHVFVLGGTICHYFAVYVAVLIDK